jgi:A/G-specific adenine glycosylase
MRRRFSEYRDLTGIDRQSPMTDTEFRKQILDFYFRSGRSLPWRDHITPYRVFVSEFMLQQTQVNRVKTKFEEFIAHCPDFEAVATASLKSILSLWQGLGYNRRALYLKQSSGVIVREYGGEPPRSIAALTALPGIGHATACAILTFSYNIPTVFVETNIRTVFIHFFFQAQYNVPDSSIIARVDETLDRQNPRQWYYALMDYGTMLKDRHGNYSRSSSHYRKQSPFKGSVREVRGKILRHLTSRSGCTADALAYRICIDPERVVQVLERLCDEKIVVKCADGRYSISE